jgi:hypothetical protein
MLWNILAIVACVQLTSSDVSHQTKETIFEEPSPAIEVVSFLKTPTREGNWKNPPGVFVCSQTPITQGRINQAIRVWERLGYEIEGAFMRIDLPVCQREEDFSWGNIIIRLRGQDFPEDKLAVTRTFKRVEDGTIVGAVIEIQAFAPEKERTMEHEIGHALGWKHFNRKYHLMNSIHTFGGWDTYGLRSPR